MTIGYDAVVLAGGAATRLGRVDKTALVVNGRPLLDRVLDAAAGARRTVVVGDERPTSRPVEWVQEEPPGGGPAAAVAAALPLVAAPVVVLLAGDLPLLEPIVVDRLVAAVSVDGAVLVDPSGRDQWLTSAWRTAALRTADLRAGGSLALALRPLIAARLDGDSRSTLDCDTAEDLRRAEELA